MRDGAPLGRRGQTSSLDAWRRSARFRGIARQNARANNEKRKTAPKCGAARKRGGTCENLALKNGRCDRHGGKTPRGEKWHTIIWPDCSTPAGALKFERKLRQQQRLAAERAKRLAAMNPARRAKYDAWCRSHPPGGRAARERSALLAQGNNYLRRLLASDPSQGLQCTELTRTGDAGAKSVDDNEEWVFS
jgi:hypothetical protein